MMRAVRVLLALLAAASDACDRAAGWLAATAGLVVALDSREVAHATAHVTGRPDLRVVRGAP